MYAGFLLFSLPIAMDLSSGEACSNFVCFCGRYLAVMPSYDIARVYSQDSSSSARLRQVCSKVTRSSELEREYIDLWTSDSMLWKGIKA